MTMTGAMRLSLILLQLAIGWHFFFEGVSKFKKDDWSSKGYLANAKGPLAPTFRRLAGAPEPPPAQSSEEKDALLLAAYQLKRIDPNEDPSKLRWHQYLPDSISKEWDEYYQSFIEAYSLKKGQQQAGLDRADAIVHFGPAIPWQLLMLADDDEPKEVKLRPLAEPVTPDVQAALAERTFVESKNQLARWLYDGKKKVKRPKVGGPAGDFELTTPERVQEYVKTRDLYQAKLSEAGFFGQDSPELKRLKAATDSLRAELAADLAAKTDGMKDSLREVLTYEQRRMALPATAKADPPPPWDEKKLARADNMVKWGLLLAGIGLIVGLFTRTSCLIGILLLMSFYMTWPPFPGIPAPPNAEGSYFIINKNLIELLALCVIAFSAPGERYGFDGLLAYFLGRRDEAPPARDPVIEVRSTAATPVADAPGSLTVREIRTAETVSVRPPEAEFKTDTTSPAGDPSPSERSDPHHGT